MNSLPIPGYGTGPMKWNISADDTIFSEIEIRKNPPMRIKQIIQ
jgi:hypothetical protein